MTNKNKLELGRRSSIIREIFAYGIERKKQIGAENVFDFSLGNPSVLPPAVVNDSIKKLLDEYPHKVHSYTTSKGDEGVREQIAEYLSKTYNTKLSKDLIYMTVGAAHGLTSTIHGLTYPGDEVIIIAPFFPEYRVYTESSGSKVVVSLARKEDFLPDIDDLRNKITEKTKLLIINYPNNPTGALIDDKTLKELCALLEEKQQEYGHEIYLLSDEPYRELTYNNEVYPFVTNYYKNSIVCYSFSKSVSLPGDRIGYIAVNPECNEATDVYCSIMGAGRSLGFVCAPALFQYLVPYCQGVTSDLNIYRENRDLLYNHLVKTGYEVIYPTGAFYMFVKSLEEDANKFLEQAKKHELLIVPSDSFGYPGYVRVSYCVEKQQIINSLDAFTALYNDYRKDN